jgi:hypothetical protein
MGILYPQYWLQLNFEESFAKQLDILKTWYCEPKVVGFINSVPKMPIYDWTYHYDYKWINNKKWHKQ